MIEEFELFKKFLINHGGSQNTASNTIGDVRQFLSIMQIETSEQLKNLKPLDIEDYLSETIELGYSDNTRKTKVARVRVFFNFLYDNNLIDKNIMRKHTVKCGAAEIVTYPHADMVKLLNNTKNGRDYAIVHTLMGTGMRISELVDLKCDKVFSDGRIQVFGKGSKWRDIYCADEVITVIKNYIAETKEIRGKSKFVFVGKNGNQLTRDGISKALKRLAERVGIDNWEQFSPHKFRHEYAMYSLHTLHIPIDVISKNLGHADVSVTSRIYAKTDHDRVREFINKVDTQRMFGKKSYDKNNSSDDENEAGD